MKLYFQLIPKVVLPVFAFETVHCPFKSTVVKETLDDNRQQLTNTVNTVTSMIIVLCPPSKPPTAYIP